MNLSDADYVALADFRYALRRFLAFSAARAAEAGLTPQQHQALLTVRAADENAATTGLVAERLLLKPHSASELVGRLEALDLIRRRTSTIDRRVSLLQLTPKSRALLETLSATHRDELRRLRPLLAPLLQSVAARDI